MIEPYVKDAHDASVIVYKVGGRKPAASRGRQRDWSGRVLRPTGSRASLRGPYLVR